MNTKTLISTLLFAHLLIIFPLNAKTDISPFEEISLDHPLPEIFRAGEIYTLKGKINNFINDVQLTADLHLLEGKEEYQKVNSLASRNGRFSIYLDLRHPGIYNLSLKINYRLIGTKLLKVINPIQIASKPLQPISNFSSSIVAYQPKLTWQTENELIQLQIVQQGIEKTYTLSNNPLEYQFDPNELAEFNPGEAVLRIRGARSIDGSWFTICSIWSDWSEIKRIFVENISPNIRSSVNFNESYVPNGDNRSSIYLNLKIKATYVPDAFIKRPDGRVNIIRLKSNKKLSEYSIGGETKELFPEGNCLIEYFPQLTGTYLVEIYDAYDNALINVPYYHGNLLPVLPQKEFAAFENIENFDLEAERIKMLSQVNSLRQKLGLKLLRLDSTLTTLSQYYSNRMAKENFCEHVAPSDGEVLEKRRRKYGIIAYVLENVAKAPNPEQAFYNLLQSPAHYSAMIDSSITLAGIGISIDNTKHFLVAQHFSADPFPTKKLDEFLSGLFQKMKAVKNDLVRIDEPPDQAHITTTYYTALSLDRIEEIVLSEKSQKIWGHESVGQIYFESFRQTIDGFKLGIKYYPSPVKKSKSE